MRIDVFNQRAETLLEICIRLGVDTGLLRQKVIVNYHQVEDHNFLSSIGKVINNHNKTVEEVMNIACVRYKELFKSGQWSHKDTLAKTASGRGLSDTPLSRHTAVAMTASSSSASPKSYKAEYKNILKQVVDLQTQLKAANEWRSRNQHPKRKHGTNPPPPTKTPHKHKRSKDKEKEAFFSGQSHGK